MADREIAKGKGTFCFFARPALPDAQASQERRGSKTQGAEAKKQNVSFPFRCR